MTFVKREMYEANNKSLMASEKSSIQGTRVRDARANFSD